MRTGRLNISRGHPAPKTPHLAVVQRSEAAGTAMPAYQPVHDRLCALERLAVLRERGTLSDAEFAVEKALILERRPDAQVLNEPLVPLDTQPRTSLLGRLFSWKVLGLGVAAGIALSFGAQPQQTMRLFDETLRLFGA